MAASGVGGLVEENAQLREELAALKKRYGIRDDTSKTDKNRDVFNSFDSDGNGQIDASEFQQLCYECGIVIPEEQRAAALAEIDTSGDGLISFEEFNTWLLKHEEESKDDGGDDAMVMLRMRLLGKRLYRQANNANAKIKAAKLGRDGDEEEEPSSVKLQLDVSIGKCEELKSGLYLKLHNTADDRDEARAKSGCPEECPSFIYVDFGLRPEASDIDVGGLVALLKNHIGEIPQLSEEGGPYHSHSVRVVDENGEKLVRLAFFTELNPVEIGEGAVGVDPIKLVNQAEVSFESGVDLSDLKLEGYNLLDNVDGKLLLNAEVDSFAIKLVEKIGEAVGKGPRPGLTFFKSATTKVEFNSLRDLVSSFDGFEERVKAAEEADGEEEDEASKPKVLKKKTRKPPGLIRALRGAPPGPEIIEKIQDILSLFLESIPHPLRDTYEGFKNCVSGPRYVRMQGDIAGIGLEFKGLDFGEYLPDLPPPAPKEGKV